MIEDEDLEDGEIEDDEEEVQAPPTVVEKPAEPVKTEKESSSNKSKKSSSDSHHSKKSSSGSSSRKEKSHQDEDDFMSNIEAAIAENLKKNGIEPPMPSVKKPSEAEPEQDRRQSRNSRKRRKRTKDRKDQKRENSTRGKRSKVSDNDGFYMVGGSPNQSGSDSEAESSGSSYDSDEYHRLTYEERRNKRREKYGSNRERERDRERDRDRDRDRRDKKNRDAEKEVCLRFSEFGHCPDSDCNRAHEVRQPKKMELCKFWLMECCAKKDKCSYMHGDFPCKYYYLGLKCVHKDCKFMHAKPLSDNLKQILLKHLDTAPKEILGDFPRIGRENASKMIAQTHIKLCEEFNIPYETEKEKSNKIPSLLDMNIKPPDYKNDKKSSKNSSRWIQNETQSPSRDSPQRSAAAASTSDQSSGPGDVALADLQGILSEKQIESMAALGVVTVNHINNLTVAQLNDLGLSLATIGEIQATAMLNMSCINVKEEKVDEKIEEKSPPVEDIDLRETPPALQNFDVDMRVIPTVEEPIATKTSDTIMSPNPSDVDEIYKKPETPQRPSSSGNVIMSPPGGIDYSQYLKDSNLNNDDEVEDEPGLRIDETYCTSDYEQEDKKDSQSEDDQPQDGAVPNFELPLLPPSFDTSSFLKSTPVVAKIDISSSVSQLMDKETPKPAEKPSPSRDPRMRDPRMAPKASPTMESPKLPEISSPSYRDPRQKPEPSKQTSIYEIESPSEDEDLIKIDRDKDMRLPPFLRDSENGDVDLRFPFTPMSNYVPATEIDGSYGIHIFEKYEVKVVDIPKPDYSDIKRNFRQSENTQDPRLKKLCGLSETQESSAIKTGLANILPMDPRKRKLEKEDVPAVPKKLQITTILQNSKHYNDLSSSQKMLVNDVLAELSKQLKLFHADSTPNKIFDSSFINQRPKLQQILIGLGVFVNSEGDFEDIKEMPMVVTMPPNLHQLPPMIPSLPPPNLISLSQPPPSLFAGNMRPGLLGIAPNLPPFAGNFEPQDSIHMNFPPMNQGMPPFGDQYNNRDFGGQNQNNNSSNNNNNNRRDQRQQNSNFRNNNNRNNNYSRHRRN